MSVSPEPVITQEERTVCAVHPTIETTLRCNKCGRYMCARCSVLTPVGYRCKQCVHQQQDVYFTATQRDYAVAAAVAFVLSVPVSFVLPKLFLFGVIIFSIPAGGLIAELAYRATGRRRGRYIWVAVTAGIVAGAVLATFPIIREISEIIALSDELGDEMRGAATGIVFQQLLVPLLYVVLCAGGAIARLRYGK
jgi:hypothetical protein